ncbi:CLUMA_CG014993, isoform A [Clunio marinus]|uniref:CLUMA_CG014993, isoform A n=1 Tax=Clunio marinus TaxID=568069 RepID=A0A1J1ITE2_9DIPT|nr:CLUMA_CG014993, isoform A [Clunio marinus]
MTSFHGDFVGLLILICATNVILGQAYSYSLNNPKDKVYSTKESSSDSDDSYLGYSSITGDFSGDGSQGVAVGMPRGASLLGKVLIFSWNLTNQINITGEQIGAYFGYSLCAVDVDGDKLEDIIIGAPMYTEKNNEGKYENGRVYIVYQTRSEKFREVETREGKTSKGRFGLSLASLGDLNLDGYGDFAVGEPYGGKNGRGAVHIYYGSKNGPLEKASQIIYAEDVVGTDHLTTFGFSLSGGIDLDGNKYPDMVVGAYESNRAIVFKSRAVVVMEASTTFEAHNKLISLEEKNCSIGPDRSVPCTKVKSCLKYNGINLPVSIDVEVSWVLDPKSVNVPRLFFLNDHGKNIKNSTMRLSRGKPECRTEDVYISENIRDKLTPLEVEMKYNIRRSSSSYTSSTVSRRRRATLDPVIDENRGTVQQDSINIMKNCGPDNICIPDLNLKVVTEKRYVVGSNESLIIEVFVANNGEDAFEANFFMTVPPSLHFQKTTKVFGSPHSCTAPSNLNNNTLKCDIGNPLPAGKSVKFKVLLEPSVRGGKNQMNDFYDFYMEANTTNSEADGGRFDNIVHEKVKIFVDSDFNFTGSVMPSDIIHYNASHYKTFKAAVNEEDIGPQIIHKYEIQNVGSSGIEEIEVFIYWPAETLNSSTPDPIIYLLSQPETSGPVRCDPSQHVHLNYYNRVEFLKKNVTLETRSYIDQGHATRLGERVSGPRMNTPEGIPFDENEDSRESSARVSLNEQNRKKQSGYSQSWKQSGSSGSGSGSGGVMTQTSYTETHHQAGASGGERLGGSQGSQRWSQSSSSGSSGSNSGSGSGVVTQESRRWSQSGSGGSSGSSSGSGGGVVTQTSHSESDQHAGGSGGSGSGVVTQESQRWSQSGSSGSSSGSGGVVTQTSQTESHQQAGGDRVGGHSFAWDSAGDQGSASGSSQSSQDQRYGSGGYVAGSGSQSSQYDSRHGSNVGESSGYDRSTQYGYDRSSTVGAGNGNAREYEYHETYNSSSINGGPVVTHVASRNRTIHRGSDGQVMVSETSTERIITGGYGSRSFEESSAFVTQAQLEQAYANHVELRRRYDTGDREVSLSAISKSLADYERIRKVLEEQRNQRQHEDRRRLQDEQRRAEEQRRQQDEERRRYEASRVDTQSQNRGSSGRESSYDRRVESSYNSGGSRSSSDAFAGGRTEANYESNVDQDISKLSARTHAEHEQSSGSASHSGRRRLASQQDGEAPRYNIAGDVSAIEKAAQGGRGFQTYGFDVGVVGARNNVDDEMRRQSSSGGGIVDGSAHRSSSSYSSQHSSGSRHGNDYSQTHSSQNSYHQGHDDDNFDDEYEDVEENLDGSYEDHSSQVTSNQYQSGGGGGGNVYTRHHTVSYSHPLNVRHETVDNQFKLYPKKRDVSAQMNNLDDKDLCSATQCYQIRCVVGPLDKNAAAYVALRTRLVVHTLEKLAPDTEVKLSTLIRGRVTKLPYIGELEAQEFKSHEIVLKAVPNQEPKPEIIPLWIYVLAAVVGALILLLLIYLLYKCGFFKRNRPTGSPHERQPLNRNGNYHGDEHL